MMVQPSPDQVSAVISYAKKMGPNWKRSLIAEWNTGTDVKNVNGHLLRQVRNQFGPSWLYKINL